MESGSLKFRDRNTTEDISYRSSDLDVFLSGCDWTIPLQCTRARPFKRRDEQSSLNFLHCDKTTSYFTVWLERRYAGAAPATSSGALLFTVLLENVRQSSMVVVLIICHFKAVVLSCVVIVFVVPVFTLNSMAVDPAQAHRVGGFVLWHSSPPPPGVAETLSQVLNIYTTTDWFQCQQILAFLSIVVGVKTSSQLVRSRRDVRSCCCAKLDISLMCLDCLFWHHCVNMKNDCLL